MSLSNADPEYYAPEKSATKRLKQKLMKALCIDEDAEEAYRLYTLTFSEYIAMLEQSQVDGEGAPILSLSNLSKHSSIADDPNMPDHPRGSAGAPGTQDTLSDAFVAEPGSIMCPCLGRKRTTETGHNLSGGLASNGTEQIESKPTRPSAVTDDTIRSTRTDSILTKDHEKNWEDDQQEEYKHSYSSENGSTAQDNSTEEKSSSSTMGLLEREMHPSAPILLQNQVGSRTKYKKPAPSKSTFAGFLGSFKANPSNSSTGSRGSINDDEYSEFSGSTVTMAQSVTTLLHEAERLGSSKLSTIFIKRSADQDTRNGMRRTALHCACGGLTKWEEEYLACTHYMSLLVGKNNKFSKEHKTNTMFLPASVGIRSEERQRLVEEEEERTALKQMNDPKSSGYRMINFPFLKPVRRIPEDSALEDSITMESQESPNNEQDTAEHAEASNRQKERFKCVLELLSFEPRAMSVNAVDIRGRTALHYAAELGRRNLCDAILSSSDAILTVIDDSGLTPCELAATAQHFSLAASLEARAILVEDMHSVEFFSPGISPQNRGESLTRQTLCSPYCWFETLNEEDADQDRMQRLNLASDQLSRFLFHDFNMPVAVHNSKVFGENNESKNYALFLDGIQTLKSRLANKPLVQLPKYFTSVQTAQFLEHYKWNNKAAMVKFEKNPRISIEAAKLVMKPISHSHTSPSNKKCHICLQDDILPGQWFQLRECKHSFCTPCLKSYVKTSAKQTGYRIPCPVCRVLISERNIDQLCKDDADLRNILHESELENFVTSAADLRYCPHVNCKGIVRRIISSHIIEAYDESCVACLPAVCTAVTGSAKLVKDAKCTYEGVANAKDSTRVDVQPVRAHRFCFTCGKDPHWPARCEQMDLWKKKLENENIDTSDHKENPNSFEEIANDLWLKANTRPCPKCHVPIEKNEGCNHMTCSNRRCKHEFCWICRQPWRLHGKRTGGHFRCNKWQDDDSTNGDPGAGDDPLGDQSSPLVDRTANSVAQATLRASQAMSRFIHHYSRYNAHKESYDLEQNMADHVCERLKPVIAASAELLNSGIDVNWKGLSFIHNGFMELRECRSILMHSYIYAFFRFEVKDPSAISARSKKEVMTFESLQSDLEMITEHLSDIVGRTHIRATHTQISFLTNAAAEKRREMFHCILKALREEGKILERQLQVNTTWSCTLCTYANQGAMDTCQMCGSNKTNS